MNYKPPFRKSFGRLSLQWYIKDKGLRFVAQCEDEKTAKLIVKALNLLAKQEKDSSPAAELPTKELE